MAARATVRLTVNLSAIAANYGRMCRAMAGGAVGAVVKADGYGLGANRIAGRLAREGCRDFFVATVGEGVRLRRAVPDVRIVVFAGATSAREQAGCVDHDLIPVVNTTAQLDAWRAGRGHPIAVHVDTGMERLGLSYREFEPSWLAGFRTTFLMTHLACADTPAHPLNVQQLGRFSRVAAALPGIPTSIGNSAGTLLGPDYQGDLARPGIGLYGGNPFVDRDPGLEPAARLMGQVLQLRDVPEGHPVGYGASQVMDRPRRVGVVGLGYADGLPRLLSGRGHGFYDGAWLTVLGRISMDLTLVDATGTTLGVGDWVEFLGPAVGVDAVAGEASTISYEILTGLKGVARRYLE